MLVLCRTHRIAPPSGPVDFFAAVMKQGIVQGQSDRTGSTERSGQYVHQFLPKCAHTPVRIGKETMKRIVGMLALGVGKGKHPRHRSSDGAENPAHRQSHKDDATGLGENRKELLDQRRPCRYIGDHTNLLVVYGCSLPIQSSGDWYFFVRKTWKLVA